MPSPFMSTLDSQFVSDSGAVPPIDGLGKSLNVDVSGGVFGGLPKLGGWNGVPYIPATPLGALAGLKGDLIIPIVIIGVATFLLLLIVLAVKFAIAFKLELLKGGKFRRDIDDNTITMVRVGPTEENQLNELAHIVLTAIQSQSCAQNMICELGILARERQGLAGLLRILETLVPVSLQEPLNILRSSAEGTFKCDEKFPCREEKLSNVNTSLSSINATTLQNATQKI